MADPTPFESSTAPTDACAAQYATADDGTVLRACAHGGHLLGWQPTGAAEQLWLSPTARCGPGQAIRGGVPVIFPQFAGRGPLPKHGFARDRAWQLTCTTTDGEAAVDAVLTDDGDTRAIWPHRFTLTLRLRASGRRLSMSLTVRNDDDSPFRFTAALHTYFAVADAAAATVEGLGGAAGEDNAAQGAPVRLPDAPFPALGPRDLALPGQVGPLCLVEPGRRLELTHDGFTDLVVWNPGPDHGLGDVPADGAHHFVCLEAAQLAPVTLADGRSWTAHAHCQVASPGA
jgi:glucose-6-phosphate 1-epimerase